ncbi:hypothetical protein D3C87_2116720 [compost metagenome]
MMDPAAYSVKAPRVARPASVYAIGWRVPPACAMAADCTVPSAQRAPSTVAVTA